MEGVGDGGWGRTENVNGKYCIVRGGNWVRVGLSGMFGGRWGVFIFCCTILAVYPLSLLHCTCLQNVMRYDDSSSDLSFSYCEFCITIN